MLKLNLIHVSKSDLCSLIADLPVLLKNSCILQNKRANNSAQIKSNWHGAETLTSTQI